MELPECCGSEMRTNMELGRFVEAKCNRCGDVVYVKCYGQLRPQLLDD